MSNNVFIKFRSYLPGAGYSRSGSPKQGKTNVRGRLEVTYERGGDSFTPADMGLDTVDGLALTLEEPCPNHNPVAGRRTIEYSHSARQFYILTDVVGVPTEAATSTSLNVMFDAFGDSAGAPELT